MESSASEPLVVPEVKVLAIEQLLPLVATGALMGMTGPSPAVITALMGVVTGGGKSVASSAMGVDGSGKVELSPKIII